MKQDKQSTIDLETVEIYSDGACEKNPGGRSGTACVVRYLMPVNGADPKEETIVWAGGFRSSTNNRMEIIGAIEGIIRAIEVCQRIQTDGRKIRTMKIVSDSSYLCGAFNQRWIQRWKQNNWKTSTGEPVKNVDLWNRISSLLETVDSMGIKWRFAHIKGHFGYKWNEMCDRLAVGARRKPVNELGIDTYYEKYMK
jgi:ribonuclease HI